jgi:hypothetical protein
MEETGMKDIKEQVEKILKNYPEMKQQLQVLKYELEALQPTLDPRTIENNVFAYYGGERVSNSKPSDKTADLVINHVDNQRNAKYHTLHNVIYTIGTEIRRLEYYISLLPKEEAEIIRWFYFEGLTWTTITNKAFKSQSTAQRCKNNGFNTLVRFYSTLDNLSEKYDCFQTVVRFVSYLHEERYLQCQARLTGEAQFPSIEAMIYLISGCNELWSAGIDTFFDFETQKMKQFESAVESFNSQSVKLLRLANCYGLGFNTHDVSHLINNYFTELEHMYLELAIESLRLTQIFGLTR